LIALATASPVGPPIVPVDDGSPAPVATGGSGAASSPAKKAAAKRDASTPAKAPAAQTKTAGDTAKQAGGTGAASESPAATSPAQGAAKEAAPGTAVPKATIFVTTAAPTGQTVADLLEQRFSVTATCKTACDLTTTVFVPLDQARDLGYEGTGPTLPGVQVASSWTALRAGAETRIWLVVSEEGKELLAKAKNDLTLVGRVTAIDRAKPDRQGRADWETVLRGSG
jgi:hypothetical protein